MSKKNLDNLIAARGAKDARKAELEVMSDKQRVINQHSPKARQILGMVLRMPTDVQAEVKDAVNKLF